MGSVATQPANYTKASEVSAHDWNEYVVALIDNALGFDGATNTTTKGGLNVNSAYDLPTADGTAKTFFKTDGAGTVSQGAPSEVQTDAPAVPFSGQLWYDSDATPSIVSTYAIATKTAAYTLTSDDVVILCKGTFTITLPTAVGIEGKLYHVKNIGTGVITIDADGTETIDGGLTAVISTQYPNVAIISDNSNWHIL